MANANRIRAGEAFLEMRVDDEGFNADVEAAARQLRVLEEANRRINAENRRAQGIARQQAAVRGGIGGVGGGLAAIGGAALAGVGSHLAQIAVAMRRIAFIPFTAASAFFRMLQRLGPIARQAGSAVVRLGQQLQQTATLGFGSFRAFLVGLATSAAVTWPIKLASNIELATVEMAVFTGGMAKARQLLLELQTFAPKSLLSPEELAKGTALLLRYSVGAKEAEDSIKALAAISAGSAEEFQKLTLAFAQVASEGLLRGEEVRQFKNTAFNPLREIAERTGESIGRVRDRMEAGKVTFKEVGEALQFAVGPMGRFAGLLDAISNTTLGLFRKAMASFKLALLPLGEELLPVIKGVLRIINDLIPAFANWVKANKNMIITIAGTVIAITTLLGTLFLIGTALRLVGSALAGFGVVLAILFNPITLLVAGVALLLGKFGKIPAFVRKAGTEIWKELQRLFGVAQTVFKGIADAFASGDLNLAAKTLWSGLRLLWLEGTSKLADTFGSLKELMARLMVEIKYNLIGAWISLGALMESVWQKIMNKINLLTYDAFTKIVATVLRGMEALSNLPGGKKLLDVLGIKLTPGAAAQFEAIRNLKLSPEALRGWKLFRTFVDPNLPKIRQELEEEGAARLAQIEADKKASLALNELLRQKAQRRIDGETNAERAARKQRLQDAQNEFKRLAALAEEMRKKRAAQDQQFNIRQGRGGIGAGGGFAAGGFFNQAVGGGKLVQQILGVAQAQQPMKQAVLILEDLHTEAKKQSVALRHIDNVMSRANRFTVGNT